MMDSTLAAMSGCPAEEPPTLSLEKVTPSSHQGWATRSATEHSHGGGSASSRVCDISKESTLNSSCSSFSELPTTSGGGVTWKGKGKGKKSKGSGAKGPTLAHRGKASNLLSIRTLNKSTGLQSWACGADQDEFSWQHPYGHILEMPKAFTPKDVKNGSSQESPFTAIKAELKVPAGVTPTAEWFVTGLHSKMCCIHNYAHLQLLDRE